MPLTLNSNLFTGADVLRHTMVTTQSKEQIVVILFLNRCLDPFRAASNFALRKRCFAHNAHQVGAT